MLMLLLPAKFIFVKLELKQNSKTNVESNPSASFLPNLLLCVRFISLVA